MAPAPVPRRGRLLRRIVLLSARPKGADPCSAREKAATCLTCSCWNRIPTPWTQELFDEQRREQHPHPPPAFAVAPRGAQEVRRARLRGRLLSRLRQPHLGERHRGLPAE